MFELKGKYNTCKVYTDNVDNATIGQLTALLNQKSIEGSRIRIMPDTHAGAGCVIGTTMTIADKVIPNLVGVDIGCFTGDTPVWCSAGFYRTIKELAERNEEFYTDSFDIEQGAFVMSLATAFKTRENAVLVEVTYGKDIKIKCTPDHKFLTCYENNGTLHYSNETFIWVEAAKLKPGMRLVAEDSNITVKGVRELEEREDVYCLNVPDEHNFSIKGGVIVHNCGMSVAKLDTKRLELPKLDSVIHKEVPAGFSIRSKEHKYVECLELDKLRCKGSVNLDRAYKSLGTLGGGNHFIEVNKDSEGNLYLVVHTGSRNLGKQVAEYYQEEAWKRVKDGNRGVLIKNKIAELTEAGRQSEIEDAIKQIRSTMESIPRELAYCEGDLFEDYIHDMKIVQDFAYWNRAAIVDTITKAMKVKIDEEFQTIHNYIDIQNMILRKGAVSAMSGEKLIIPINMRDGSLICVGKGNDDWNQSAPHGAGRLMSRSEAKQSLTVHDFKKTMEEAGIYTTSVGLDTLDEAPMAYKPMDEIINNIQDTVDIIEIIKPIYNFKAGGE